jgi:hypothetical protein
MQTVATYKEVEPQDEAMDAFRSCFRLVANYVDADGMTMRYRFKSEATANVWLASANKIIEANSLPLVASVDVWKTGNLVHDISLIITYKPQP